MNCHVQKNTATCKTEILLGNRTVDTVRLKHNLIVSYKHCEFLAYLYIYILSLFKKIKVGLCDLRAVCVSPYQLLIV
jgi:hypothetical protein